MTEHEDTLALIPIPKPGHIRGLGPPRAKQIALGLRTIAGLASRTLLVKADY